MQIQDYPYFDQSVIQTAAPDPKEVKCEEIIRMIMFVLVGIYLVAHILFIPIEILLVALVHDNAFSNQMYVIIGVYAAKYICLIIIFYAAHHHTALYESHSHIILYLFSFICLAVTGLFTFLLYEAEKMFIHMGFGTIFQHPIYYDFIGFAACGSLGCIYLFYMACKHPKKTAYYAVPAFDPYSVFTPVPMSAYPAGSHARREAETVMTLDEATRRQLMMQGVIPMLGSHAVRELQSQPKEQTNTMRMPIYYMPQN